MPPKSFWIALVILSLLAAWLVSYATPQGMGLVNDSVAYINGARTLHAGLGYARTAGDGSTRPITHFPPAYSLLLAALGFAGLDAIPAAQVLNVLLFGASVFLAGLIVQRASRSGWAGLLVAALLALSDPLLRAHTFALSEPLFLFLTLLSFWFMWLAFEASRTGSPLFWLVLAGITASLSYLTRYVGAALLAAEMLTILLLTRGWRERVSGAGVYLLSALPLVAAWSLRNLALTGSATNRGLAYHPLTFPELEVAVQNVWAFLLPVRFNLYGRVIVQVWAVLLGLILLALAVWASVILVCSWTNRMHGSSRKLVFLVLAHALIYLAGLVFSMMFIDASTTFEDRILLPFYADVVLLLGVIFGRLFRQPGTAVRVLTGLLAVLLLLSFADDTRRALPALRQEGQGFASTRWSNSQTMDAVRRLPAVTIYTNRLSAVTVLAGRPAFALLGPIDPVSQQVRPDYEESVQNIRRAVQNGKIALVVFSARALLAGEDGPWLSAVIQDLPVWKEFEDGIIYGAFPNP